VTDARNTDPRPAPLIAVDGVGKRFGVAAGSEATRVLVDVSFTVDAGDTVGLLGRNGAGKTTLLAIVGGLLDPDEGAVRIGGIDTRSDRAVQRRVAAVLDARPPLDPASTVLDHLEIAAHAHGLEGRRCGAALERVIASLRLAPVLTRHLVSVERVERRRTVIAAAMLQQCDALLIDEPTHGLDPGATHELLSCLRAIAHDDGATMVVATHDVTVVTALCRRVVVIDAGRIVAVDTTRNLVAPLARPSYRVVVSNVSASLGSRLEAAFGGVTLVRARHHGTITAPLDHPDDLYDLMHVLETEGAVVEAIDRVDVTMDDVLLAALTPPATIARTRGWRRT